MFTEMEGLSCEELVSELLAPQMVWHGLRDGVRSIPSSPRAGKPLEAVDSLKGRASLKSHKEVLLKEILG